MPLATPKSGESEKDFIARCMGDGVMVREFPEVAQRRAVCQSQWDGKTKGSRASGTGRAVWLFAADTQPAVAVDDSNAPLPRKRFKKDIMRVGVYTHPIEGWTIDVTTERMDRWIANFKAMRKAGIDVEVCVDHDLSAEAVRGYVVDMFREGDTLYATHEMIGEKGIELAQTVRNVSFCLDTDYHDSEGRAYGEAITHCAIVQQPVIPRQGEFEPLAASKKTNAGLPYIVLHYDRTDNKGTAIMDNAMTDELLEVIRELLGSGDDLTKENALSRLKERFTAAAAEKEQLTKQIADLQGEIESLKASAAKADADKAVDPDALDVMAEATEAKIESLTEKAKITPKAASMLLSLLVGKPGARQAYMLSRRLSQTDVSLARQILDIFEMNDPVELGEKTKAQALTLSRETPGQTNADPDPAEIKSRALKVAAQAGYKLA